MTEGTNTNNTLTNARVFWGDTQRVCFPCVVWAGLCCHSDQTTPPKQASIMKKRQQSMGKTTTSIIIVVSVFAMPEKGKKKKQKQSIKKLVRSPKCSTANVRKTRLAQSFLTFTSSQKEGQSDTPHRGRDSDTVLRLPQSQVQHRSGHSQVAFNTHTGHQQGAANQVEHI